MRSQIFVLALLSAALALPAAAQQAAPAAAPAGAGPDILSVTNADVQALIAKAKAARQPNQAMAPPQPLVRLPGYIARVEYRSASTPASIHNDRNEFFQILEGSGTLVMGGTLDGAHDTGGNNQQGTGVTGGKTYALAKGDFYFVPAGTPHFFATVGADGLAVVTLYTPKQAQ